jgi:hypothetical protein
MNDLIKIQIVLLLIILPLFAVLLRRGFICLTIVLLRNIWLVLR